MMNGWASPARLVIVAGFILGATLGAAMGVGAYTFLYARGASYMTDDPAACANCHVMNEQYNAWMKSSHKHVAVCNDCHTPGNFLGKYITKARNGYHHSAAFTTGNFSDPIQITEYNRRIAEASCRTCHADMVQAVDGVHGAEDSLSCIRCHRDVGHKH